MLAIPAKTGTHIEMVPRLVFLGGIGHCTARLNPVRQELSRIKRETGKIPFELVDVQYPGFERRRRAVDWDKFLEAIGNIVQTRVDNDATIIYATGIGAMLALCLR